jgi:hypothetical protein
VLHLPITQLVSLDVYRDGGSLSAAFKTDEPQRTYTLFFPVDLGAGTEVRDPASNDRAFKPPVIEIDIMTYYKNPTTRVSSPIHRQEKKPLTWEEARTYLQHISRFLPGVQSDDLWVYDKMVVAANNEGVVADYQQRADRG